MPDGPACAGFNEVADLLALFTTEAEEAEERSELDAMPFIRAGGAVGGATKPRVDGFLLGLRVGKIDSSIWKLLITSYFHNNIFTNKHLKSGEFLMIF